MNTLKHEKNNIQRIFFRFSYHFPAMHMKFVMVNLDNFMNLKIIIKLLCLVNIILLPNVIQITPKS